MKNPIAPSDRASTASDANPALFSLPRRARVPNTRLTPLNVLEITDLDRSAILSILASAREMEAGHVFKALSGKVCATCFFQPSTRTRLSTEAAVYRLGGHVLSLGESSSLRMESLADLLRSFAGYVDLIAIRHPDHDAVVCATEGTSVPILNCGTGNAAHPTQTLAELYFIQRTFGTLDGVRILMLGDHQLRASRTLLACRNSFDIQVDLCHPDFTDGTLRARAEEIFDVRALAPSMLASEISSYDVVYVKPITNINYESPHLEQANQCVATRPLLSAAMVSQSMRPDAIVLHALPRFGEMDPDIDALPQAKYFDLAQKAIFPRMALLKYLVQRNATRSNGGN